MDKKKVIAMVLGGLTIGAGAGLIGANMFPKTITETEIVTEYVTQIEEVPVNVTEYVEVEVPVETIVEVDNENLGLVLEHIYDNDGEIEYLLEDLEDDELDLIIERIVFMNDVKSLGEEFIKSELADELDKIEFTMPDNSTITFDEDDIEKIKVKDDLSDIIVEDIDYEDSECDLIYSEVEFEHDDIDFKAVVRVEIRDGEADELEIISVELDE
jgi:hypothetical protein